MSFFIALGGVRLELKGWVLFPLALLILSTLPFGIHYWRDLASCAGRCGEGYSRENGCQCDYYCQRYMECCPDYKTVCTEELSCKGRCFENFVRGRECDCDKNCDRFGKCCPDYQQQCSTGEYSKNKRKSSKSIVSDELRLVSEEVGSGLDNVRSRPTSTTKQPDTVISTQGYKDVPDEMNLCNQKPANGMVALQNGTLAVFRGHYYWLLDGSRPPTPAPRRITEAWGVPSPIDAVFSRCNCDGKTFFFKDSQYWRFTNDVQDEGYPKPIMKGFANLNGKIVAALSVAKHNSRPESVYFFKKGGNVQQYTYKQEPTKKCKKKQYITVKYPSYTQKAVIRRRRFERALRPPQIYRTIRINYYPTGILHDEVKTTSYWRRFPKPVHSAISIPNHQKPDGYDYYAFSKDQYYNVDVGSRIARSVTSQTGKTVAKDWYKCPLE
uniref:SMB domain-containing protein n=1 Tax=Sphenodon punctatus TaxID=8508 RepID=A0A8D0L3J0_SPHPU